jgi:hypothetical protein
MPTFFGSWPLALIHLQLIYNTCHYLPVHLPKPLSPPITNALGRRTYSPNAGGHAHPANEHNSFTSCAPHVNEHNSHKNKIVNDLIKWGVPRSFQSLKTGSQLLEIGLQIPHSVFFRNRFLWDIAKTSFYKSSMDPNRPLITPSILFLSLLTFWVTFDRSYYSKYLFKYVIL